MLHNSLRKIVIGPPGTGKTTFLKNKVDAIIKEGKAQPNEIGYFSFTVKAAEEIRNRVARESWSENELKKMYPYFCTLHSLAYKCLRLEPHEIMDELDYEELSDQTGRKFVNKMKKGNGIDISMPTAQSQYQDIINLAYAKYPNDKDRLQKIFREVKLPDFGARNTIMQMDRDLSNFKRDRHKLEYVDYFNNFLECKNPPKLKYLFIDEAQDLSAHQWMVVDMIQKISQPIETYIAGDDDQAIFRWAGADIEHFINMAKSDENQIIPLTQSYRVPKSVHTLATKMAQSITNRIDKQYNPRDDEGERKVLNFRPLNKTLENGEWLILCRTHEIVKQVCGALDKFGWLYKVYGNSVVNDKIIEAIVSWTRLQKGEKVSGARVDTIYSFMDSTRIKRGHGTFKGSHTEMYSIDDLINKFGLREYIKEDLFTKTLDWYDVLNAKGIRKRIKYLRAVRRNKLKLDDKPRIEVSTIHASKGGERDNVMLLTDLSYGPYKSSRDTQQGRDDELRVFYVGATRAKKQLVIVHTTEAQFEFEPIFFHERQAS
jgi:superfamily I DNA/RNA helicase